MKTRALLISVVAVVMGLTLPGTAAVAGAADTTSTTSTGSSGSSDAPNTVEQLFVQTAGAGTLKPVKGEQGVYTLTLRDVPATVTSFTDRPLRVSSNLDTDGFVQLWDGGTFGTDPPNAALVIADAPTSRDTFVFELTKPAYDPKTKRLRYTATAIDGAPKGRLAGFAADVDQNPPSRFGRASLFVDSLPSTTMTVTISGVPANGIGGYVVGGFTDTFESSIVQGNVVTIASAANGDVIVTGDQDGTATVNLTVYFCVNPGQASTDVGLSGSSAGTTVSFVLGNLTAQTFTGPGTLSVPSEYQLQGCGQ